MLHYGCHRGTVTSRDSSSPVPFDTEEEARKRYMEHKHFYESIGYMIWFAYIITPDGNKIHLEANSYV